MDEQSELLNAIQEIRDLVRLLAEPAIAERDQKLRSELKRIVGNSRAKQKSATLMDGNHTQSDIQRETNVNQGHLSTMVKQLKENKLLNGDGKKPKLAISIPPNFFESGGKNER